MHVAITFLLILSLPVLLVPARGAADRRRSAWFLAALVALVGLAALRARWATRLDGFTVDEPYHIVAGVSYVRTGDFRLNPEHPPLTKVWVGSFLAAGRFKLPPFRPLSDKYGERQFVGTATYVTNDPDRVRSQAQGTMLLLNGLLLLGFGLALRRAVGEGIALGAVTFLAIDPTVAAHLPVVMTDLPIALTSGTAVLLAAVAFRSWRPVDLAAASLALGLALAVKHSGLVTLAVVGVLGLVLALWTPADRARRLGLLAAVLLGAIAVLWGTYGLRFRESTAGTDLFNRPLAQKIEDLRTPAYREGLRLAERGHVLPRAYLWGLADILRAGMEGRGEGMLAFGRWHPLDAPWYFFPGAILVKVPLGLILLALLGAAHLAVRGEAGLPFIAVLLLAVVFLAFLGAGSAYAGVRHAMTVFPLLALLAGVGMTAAVQGGWPLRAVAGAGLVAAAVSALPVVRPWEYFNELIGPERAYLCFSDEGVDLGQRTLDLARYYHRELRHRKEPVLSLYWISKEELARRKIRATEWASLSSVQATDRLTGTFLIRSPQLSPHPRFDLKPFRDAQPVARLGNLFVYRGTFRVPWHRSMAFYDEAMGALHAKKDPLRAEALLAEAVRLYPAHYVAAIELGNLRARRGLRREAIQAFELARAQATPGDPIVDRLDEQIRRLRREPPSSVSPVRSPWAE